MSEFSIEEFPCGPKDEYFDAARHIISAEIYESAEIDELSPETFGRRTTHHVAIGCFDLDDELLGAAFLKLNPARTDLPEGSAWLSLLAVTKRLQTAHGIGSSLLRRAETIAGLEQRSHVSLSPTDTSWEFYLGQGYDFFRTESVMTKALR